jgi:hypothetical protein
VKHWIKRIFKRQNKQFIVDVVVGPFAIPHTQEQDPNIPVYGGYKRKSACTKQDFCMMFECHQTSQCLRPTDCAVQCYRQLDLSKGTMECYSFMCPLLQPCPRL